MTNPIPAAQQLPSLGHTIWVRNHNVAFVYLPKVACTSWKLFLARALNLPLPGHLPLAAVHNRDTVQLPYVSSLEASEQEQFQQELLTGNISLLAVIREPRERVLSAYLDKIWLHRNPNSYFSQVALPEMRTELGLSDADRPSFLQFLQWLERGCSTSCRNDHWQPQRELIGLPETLPNSQLWAMEDQSQAVEHLQKLLMIDLPFPEREELAPRQSSGSRKQMQQTFTPQVTELFGRLYAQDILLHRELSTAAL